MKPPPFSAALWLAALLFVAGPSRAGEGHDHGEAAPSGGGPALPRFAAASEAFELVGVLNGKLITLYLDRASDNSPVPDAQIELEIGGAKLQAEKHEADTYEVVLAAAPKPGVLPITATVTVGKEVDLLAGEVDVHDETSSTAAPHTHSWKEYAAWGAGGIAAIVALAWIVRRVRAPRSLRAGGAA